MLHDIKIKAKYTKIRVIGVVVVASDEELRLRNEDKTQDWPLVATKIPQ